MRLTDKQLKRFTEVFEIKAKFIIMIDKRRKKYSINRYKKAFEITKDILYNDCGR